MNYFEKMKLYLRDKLNKNLKLSMGMSNDYEISLKYGIKFNKSWIKNI